MSRRYYFAYHDVNGMTFPLAWVEDEGICVGGRPKEVSQMHEISEEEFSGPLLNLERKYPLELPSLTSPPNDTS